MKWTDVADERPTLLPRYGLSIHPDLFNDAMEAHRIV
jgi:hypothetical protein